MACSPSFDVDGHLPVTLMKIDLEGTEDEVLADGDRFLAGTQPDILCEFSLRRTWML